MENKRSEVAETGGQYFGGNGQYFRANGQYFDCNGQYFDCNGQYRQNMEMKV